MTEFAFEETGSALIVRIMTKRVDAMMAMNFRKSVIDKIGTQSVVIMDFSAVSFMDSSGLGALVSILKKVPSGGQLRLSGVGDNVKSLLKITHMDQVFFIFPSLGLALEG